MDQPWAASQAAAYTMIALHVTLIVVLLEMRIRVGMMWSDYKKRYKINGDSK